MALCPFCVLGRFYVLHSKEKKKRDKQMFSSAVPTCTGRLLLHRVNPSSTASAACPWLAAGLEPGGPCLCVPAVQGCDCDHPLAGPWDRNPPQSHYHTRLWCRWPLSRGWSLWWMINPEMASVKQLDFCRARYQAASSLSLPISPPSLKLPILPPCVPLTGNHKHIYTNK